MDADDELLVFGCPKSRRAMIGSFQSAARKTLEGQNLRLLTRGKYFLEDRRHRASKCVGNNSQKFQLTQLHLSVGSNAG